MPGGQRKLTGKTLPPGFYRRADVVALGRELLGKLLCTSVDGSLCKAIISETEAYAGETDRASHAFGGSRTARTEVMYAAGGRAYVYLCYGIHSLFNVVTNVADTPHAVLIRAALPIVGQAVMRQRRERDDDDAVLMNGPGKVAQGMGITTAHSSEPLDGRILWLEDAGLEISPAAIICGPRVGVDYAGEDAYLPYRCRLSEEFAQTLLS